MNIEKKKSFYKNFFVNNLRYYHKSNLVRAPLEALITIYLAELALMLSKWFVNRLSLNASQIILMVFIPLLFALIVCLVYSGVVILLINRELYKLINIIDISDIDANMNTIYFQIEDKVKSIFQKIHAAGATCYLAVGILVYLSLSNKIFCEYNLNNMIIISLYCFFMGIVWNVYGYYSDRRIDWSKIFKNLNINISQNADIQKIKYKYYERSVKWQLISIFTICFSLVLIFVRFDYDLIPEGSLDILITYSAFAAWFIAILKLYFTQMFGIFFTHEKKGSEIFPSESEILTERECSQ